MEEGVQGSSKKVQGILVLLIVVFGAAAVYFYTQLSAVRKDPQKAIQEETSALVAEVGRLIVLPKDEVPTTATVLNPEELKSQPFFANAKKGDRLLIYTNARKAILYDPIGKKIVEVAPLNIGESAPTPTPAPAATTPKTEEKNP